MVIAATLVYSNGLTPLQAVKLIREKRPGAVQCNMQVEALHKLKLLLCNGKGLIIPKEKLGSIKEYLDYNKYFINKAESRLYGHIPKVVYLTMLAILEVFFEKVDMDLVKLDNGYYVFQCKCYKMTEKLYYDESELEVGLLGADLSPVAEWYTNLMHRGMTISAYEYFLKVGSIFTRIMILQKNTNFLIQHLTDFRQLVRFLDYFFHATFHQLCKKLEKFSKIGHF
ncbi:hypothetical protein WR25_22660 isoform B [Diploscapter pachys]|uniref:Uncharacterized protein n=1 Tax=Diploscapter pachys TaxID=2018661 RepID=A0A2A2L242_9BILA|nr:hypothetical protein WR25_22660 isoform B [Diploscapter pachys]